MREDGGAAVSLRHWTRALRAIAAEAAHDIRGRRGMPFLRGLAGYGLHYRVQPRAPLVHLFELYPELEGLAVEMGTVQYRRANVNPYDLWALKAITALRNPRRILEVGTYDGATTLELARSAPAAEVFTLDVLSTQGLIGCRFAAAPERSRITQLTGDSQVFNFSGYERSIDVIFVDACHDYHVVKADTETALRLVAPDGVILWHDYNNAWPGVVQAINELADRHPVRRVIGTNLAILDTRTSASSCPVTDTRQRSDREAPQRTGRTLL